MCVPLTEELSVRDTSGLLCRLFFLFWLLLLLLCLSCFSVVCPFSFSILFSWPPSFSFFLFFLLSSLSPAFLSLPFCLSRSLELLDLWSWTSFSTVGLRGEEVVDAGGCVGGGGCCGESEEDAGKERYLSFRLLTSFRLRSSTPTTGSSSS